MPALFLENIILSEVSQRDKYGMILLTCGISKKKKSTNEHIYKTERLTNIENILMATKGEDSGEGCEELGINIHILLYVK